MEVFRPMMRFSEVLFLVRHPSLVFTGAAISRISLSSIRDAAKRRSLKPAGWFQLVFSKGCEREIARLVDH